MICPQSNYVTWVHLQYTLYQTGLDAGNIAMNEIKFSVLIELTTF